MTTELERIARAEIVLNSMSLKADELLEEGLLSPAHAERTKALVQRLTACESQLFRKIHSTLTVKSQQDCNIAERLEAIEASLFQLQEKSTAQPAKPPSAQQSATLESNEQSTTPLKKVLTRSPSKLMAFLESSESEEARRNSSKSPPRNPEPIEAIPKSATKENVAEVKTGSPLKTTTVRSQVEASYGCDLNNTHVVRSVKDLSVAEDCQIVFKELKVRRKHRYIM